MSRVTGVFYVSPFKAFKVGVRPRSLQGIGQWSGGTSTTAAEFKYIGAQPYNGWFDTQDVLLNVKDKLPHQVGGWVVKTRPNGLQGDIAYLVYSQVHILFSGRRKEQPLSIVPNSPPKDLPGYNDPIPGVPASYPGSSNVHAMHVIGSIVDNAVKGGIVG